MNIPKVIFTQDKKMIYMSRQKIPGSKNSKLRPKDYYKAVCIYAFNKEELALYRQYGKKSELEKSEDIEILRFLDLNITIRLVETQSISLAVDVPEDVKRVEDHILNS